jgi:hypothetical protein
MFSQGALACLAEHVFVGQHVGQLVFGHIWQTCFGHFSVKTTNFFPNLVHFSRPNFRLEHFSSQNMGDFIFRLGMRIITKKMSRFLTGANNFSTTPRVSHAGQFIPVGT